MDSVEVISEGERRRRGEERSWVLPVIWDSQDGQPPRVSIYMGFRDGYTRVKSGVREDLIDQKVGV